MKNVFRPSFSARHRAGNTLGDALTYGGLGLMLLLVGVAGAVFLIGWFFAGSDDEPALVTAPVASEEAPADLSTEEGSVAPDATVVAEGSAPAPVASESAPDAPDAPDAPEAPEAPEAAVANTVAEANAPAAAGSGDAAQADAAQAKVDAATIAGWQADYGICLACHGIDGKGMAGGMAPGLVGSPLAIGDPEAAVALVLRGIAPSNPPAYPQIMMSWEPLLKDEQIANALSYIRNSFGHSASPITAEFVAEIRAKYAALARPLSREELASLPGGAEAILGGK